MDSTLGNTVNDRWKRFTGFVDAVIPQYSPLLLTLEGDSVVGDAYYLGFKRAPAAKKNHHAEEGGLVKHYLEMWYEYVLIKDAFESTYSRLKNTIGTFNEADVLKGIINHDLHKAHHTYRLITEKPWQTEYGRNETEDYSTDNMKTLWLLGRSAIILTPLDINVLCWSEGGFAAHPRPRERTALATFVYLLDELSGNVCARIREGTDMVQNPHRKWESGGTR